MWGRVSNVGETANAASSGFLLMANNRRPWLSAGLHFLGADPQSEEVAGSGLTVGPVACVLGRIPRLQQGSWAEELFYCFLNIVQTTESQPAQRTQTEVWFSWGQEPQGCFPPTTFFFSFETESYYVAVTDLELTAWPGTQRFACFSLLSAGIQGVRYHAPAG